jgi:hypothetical protein
MPASRYHLYDLTTYSDEEIQGEIILRASLLLLKYIFRPELEQQLRDILRLLQAVSEPRTGLEYLEMALRYIASSIHQLSDVAFEAESLAEFEAALYQAKLGGNDQNGA